MPLTRKEPTAPRILMVAVTLAAAVLAPASASAQVLPAGTGEPAYTRSAQNTQWVEWPAVSGADAYRIRASYRRDTVEVADPTYDVALSASNYWLNWSGVAALEHGRSYGICVQGQYSLPNDSLFFSDGPTSCTAGTNAGKRTSTTIDRSKPAASVDVAGGATAVRNTLMAVHLGYQDDVSPPFPANFLCVAPGPDATTACGSAIFGFTPACSTPAAGGKNTSFDCQMETSGINPPDGPLFVCAIAADSSIPDNPTSSNQGSTPDQANLSEKACDSVVMDRTPPSATINTAATTVATGESVAFTAQASDATSGLSADPVEWSWNDGAAGSSGDSVSHTFTRAGTYSVQLKVTDVAGNATTATKAVTVLGPSSHQGSNSGSGKPSANGPTAAQVAQAAGGGTVQSARVGDMTVLAPRRVALKGGRRSFLLGVTTARPGLLKVALTRGRRVRARATAVLAAGSMAQRVRLPRGMKPGRHALKVSFTPAGSSRAVTRTLAIRFTKPGRKGRASAATVAAPLPARAAISTAGLPDPRLPDGRLHGVRPGRVFEVR